MTKPITIELTDEQEAQLKLMADRDSLTPETMAAQLVGRSVAYDAWYPAKVQEGLDDIAAGRVLTTEDVEARSQRRRRELLARPAER